MEKIAESAGFILVSSWTKSERRDEFSGIAYLDDSIIIGSEGYRKFSQERNRPNILQINEGRFCLVQQNGDGSVLARTDSMGQDILYYYTNQRQWGISNSFLMLAKHLKENGINLSADVDSMRLGLIPRTIVHSPICADTYIREIKILPADRYIKINGIGDNLAIELIKCGDLGNSGFVGKEEYVETLTSFATKAGERSQALLRYFVDRVKVDITGGQDSRLVLSLIAASNHNLSEINFHSNRRYEADFSAASGIAKELGFYIRNQPFPLSRTSVENTYELWKLGNAATYLPVYPPLGCQPQDALHFHGACGECYRDYYNYRAVDFAHKIADITMDRDLGLAFNRKLAKAFGEMDEDMAAPESMMIHYRHFRSRFHFGRSTYRSLTGIVISPLASPELIKATKFLSAEARTRSQLALDIILLTCPKLSKLPFDKESKKFLTTCFEQSPFRRGAPDISKGMRNLIVYASEKKAQESIQPSGSFQEKLLNDIKLAAESAYMAGIFPRGYASAAMHAIAQGARLTNDGIRGAHMISVAEVVNLVDVNSLAGWRTSFPYVRSTNATKAVARVDAWQENGMVMASMDVTSSKWPEQLEYAFYLLSPSSEKISVRWYKKDRYVTFAIPSERIGEQFKVQGFARNPTDHNAKISIMADVFMMSA